MTYHLTLEPRKIYCGDFAKSDVVTLTRQHILNVIEEKPVDKEVSDYNSFIT